METREPKLDEAEIAAGIETGGGGTARTPGLSVVGLFVGRMLCLGGLVSTVLMLVVLMGELPGLGSMV